MTNGQTERTIRHLHWMTKDFKWRHDETGIEGNYSPELLDAMDLLKELEDDVSELTPLEAAERRAKTTGNSEDLAEYLRLRKDIE